MVHEAQNNMEYLTAFSIENRSQTGTASQKPIPILDKDQLLALKALQSLAANGEKGFHPTAQGILKIVQRSVPFDAAWIIQCDPSSLATRQIHCTFQPELLSHEIDLLSTQAATPTLLQLKDHDLIAVRGSDLNEKGGWVKHPFYKKVLEPRGLLFSLAGACIDPAGKYVGMIVLWRSRMKPDFSQYHRYFLEKAAAHTGTLFMQPEPAQPENPEIMSLINRRSSPGVVLMGQTGEILLMNQQADEILRKIRGGRGPFSRTEEGKLVKRLHELRGKVLESLTEPGNQDNGAPVPVCDLLPLRGTTFSLRGIMLEGAGQQQAPVMILIEPIHERAGSSPSVQADEIKLTKREEEICMQISQGLINKEIASALGIGVHTVKDHIKNIMRKLKANTRAGIVAKRAVGVNRRNK